MIFIVISGPESSGKSTLSKYLTSYFKINKSDEYARNYVERLGRKYEFKDVETIAKRQCASYLIDKRNAEKGDIVIYDTFLIITKVWFEEVYKKCPIWLDKAIRTYKPNLVLLCYPDLDWQADGVRENGDKREILFEKYRQELEYYNIDYKLVRGFGEERRKNALSIINKWLKREDYE